MNEGGDAAEKLVRSAARIIRAQIREMDYDTTRYPSHESLSNDDESVIPPLLKLFVECLITDRVKRSSIAQSIIQSSRPKTSILSLPFALRVHLDRYGSADLIREVSKLGFCISYDEVTRYKHSVLCSTSSTGMQAGASSPVFVPYVADNVDHNVRTLDGKSSLHAMGLISAPVFPTGTFSETCNHIPR
jgi:hypothetical protein